MPPAVHPRHLLALTLGAGCAPPPDAAPLAPTEQLVRASMVLRGTRPTLEEHARIDAHPDELPALARSWLSDDDFFATVRDIHEEAWLLDNAFVLLSASDGVADVPMGTLHRTIFEAPLREIEWVVRDGRPYTDVVTGTTTVADDVLVQVWDGLRPTGRADVVDGWRAHRWVDGRPLAGVLSHSSLWLRYRSAGINFHRGRANALHRALLCDDLLEREVVSSSDVDLADPDATNEAIRTDPACASCHATLDPIASALPFRDQWRADEMQLPFAVYDPAFDDQWTTTTGIPPSFAGTPVADLAGLGRALAHDPRFVDCAVRRFAGYALQQAPEEVDDGVVAELTDTFVDAGLDARELALAAALHPATMKAPSLRATPGQLDRQLADLLGSPWTLNVDTPCCGGREGSSPYGTLHPLDDRRLGVELLAGGLDATFDDTPTRTATPTTLLVMEAMALDGASHVVAHDLGAPATERLLLVDAPLDEQLRLLHLRVLGVADPDELDESRALFEAVRRRSGDERAWQVVLVALLRDLRLLHY
jgi:hypothetical protein